MVKTEFGLVSFTLSHGKKLCQQKQTVTMIHFQVLNTHPDFGGPIPLTPWDGSSGVIVTQRMEQQPPHHQGKAEQRKEQTHEAVSRQFQVLPFYFTYNAWLRYKTTFVSRTVSIQSHTILK